MVAFAKDLRPTACQIWARAFKLPELSIQGGASKANKSGGERPNLGNRSSRRGTECNMGHSLSRNCRAVYGHCAPLHARPHHTPASIGGPIAIRISSVRRR